MNNTVSSQAQKGFKTFIVTLSVSLALFGVVYYFLNKNTATVNIEDDVLSYETSAQTETPGADLGTGGEEVLAQDTVFGTLSTQQVDVPSRAVLAGAQTSQSTSPVPNTGSVEITYAIFLSSVLIGAATFMYLNGTRKGAIASFEKDVLKSLDKDR